MGKIRSSNKPTCQLACLFQMWRHSKSNCWSPADVDWLSLTITMVNCEQNKPTKIRLCNHASKLHSCNINPLKRDEYTAWKMNNILFWRWKNCSQEFQWLLSIVGTKLLIIRLISNTSAFQLLMCVNNLYITKGYNVLMGEVSWIYLQFSINFAIF